MDTIAAVMSLGFAGISSMRPLGAWKRSPEDCRPFADSLAAAVGGMSPQAADLLAKVAPWLSLAFNGYALVAPSVERESALRRAIAAGYRVTVLPNGEIDLEAPGSLPGAPAPPGAPDPVDATAGNRIPNFGEVPIGTL